jgi:hypothetical protein
MVGPLIVFAGTLTTAGLAAHVAAEELDVQLTLTVTGESVLL